MAHHIQERLLAVVNTYPDRSEYVAKVELFMEAALAIEQGTDVLIAEQP